MTLSWTVSAPVVFQRWCVLAASLHPMNESLASGASSFWYWRCGLKTTFPYLLLLLGYRGLGPPCPSVPPPTIPPPPRSLLPMGIVRGHPSSISTFLVLNLVNARGRSTLEAGQRPRPVNSLTCFIAPLMGPLLRSHYVNFGQRPRKGRYTSPPVLS